MRRTHSRGVVQWSVMVTALLAANIQVAYSHDWWKYCWHKNPLTVWVHGSHTVEAKAALADWDNHSDVCFNYDSSGYDIEVLGANWGPTKWTGRARILQRIFDFGHPSHNGHKCRIIRARATYNSYVYLPGGTGPTSDIRGIFCHEVGHCLSLNHSNHGCMGKGYYSFENTTVTHNHNDINAKF
jgi:hypothetical protein